MAGRPRRRCGDGQGNGGKRRAGRLYISTTRRLAAIDLKTDKVVWEQSYEGHCCDRIAVSPDGQTIYAPAFGSAKWYVIHAATGELRATVAVTGWPRQTIVLTRRPPRLSGRLGIADPVGQRHGEPRIVKTVGPFSASLCPFTVNARGTLAFANVDGLVGFEVGDLQTGLILDSVAVEGYDKDAAAKYECPSHGIAFTPGRARALGGRRRAQPAPRVRRQRLSAGGAGGDRAAAQPRWIAFSIDGRYAYPSTGDMVDAASQENHRRARRRGG